jgi:hypothetical protein
VNPLVKILGHVHNDTMHIVWFDRYPQHCVLDKELRTVIDCQKIGYKIKDQGLQAAKVGVAQDSS